MLNKAKQIGHRLTGLFLDDSQKMNILGKALDSNVLKLVEAALMKGAKPAMQEIDFLLRSENPPTLEFFKDLCELFSEFGADLNEPIKPIAIVSDKYDSEPTIISSIIRYSNYSEEAINYLLERGVQPTGADVWVACRVESDRKYLKVLLDSGIDPYNYVPKIALIGNPCILFETIKYRDLDKLKLASQYPYQGDLPRGVAQALHKLFLAAERKEGFTPEFADFATEAAKYLGHLKEDALRIHSKYR